MPENALDMMVETTLRRELQAAQENVKTLSAEAIRLHDELELRAKTVAELRVEVQRLSEENQFLRADVTQRVNERDEARMLHRDVQIQAMDRGASYQVAMAECERLRVEANENREQHNNAVTCWIADKTILGTTLDAANARLALLEPVWEIARRWCNRPVSVTKDWLQNDAEMFYKLHAAVHAAAEGGQ